MLFRSHIGGDNEKEIVRDNTEAFKDETIDVVGKCANCGVEYHIHKIKEE